MGSTCRGWQGVCKHVGMHNVQLCSVVLARTRSASVRFAAVSSLAPAAPGFAAAASCPLQQHCPQASLRAPALAVQQQGPRHSRRAPCHSGCGCGPLSITSHCAYQMPGTPHASRDTCCPRSTTPQPRANRCSAGVFASAADRLRPTGSGCSRRRQAASARRVRAGDKLKTPARNALEVSSLPCAISSARFPTCRMP